MILFFHPRHPSSGLSTRSGGAWMPGSFVGLRNPWSPCAGECPMALIASRMAHRHPLRQVFLCNDDVLFRFFFGGCALLKGPSRDWIVSYFVLGFVLANPGLCLTASVKFQLLPVVLGVPSGFYLQALDQKVGSHPIEKSNPGKQKHVPKSTGGPYWGLKDVEPRDEATVEQSISKAPTWVQTIKPFHS